MPARGLPDQTGCTKLTSLSVSHVATARAPQEIEAAMDAQSPSDVVFPPLMRAGGELSREAAAALCRHPRFPDAMRAVLTDNVRLYRGNRILNYVATIAAG